jgi:tetratricopeptide (TPR) repeat protein
LLNQAITHFEHVDDPLLEGECSFLFKLFSVSYILVLLAKFYHAAGAYLITSGMHLSQSMQFYQQALESFKLCQDSNALCNLLIDIAQLKYRAGDYSTALENAIEVQRPSRSLGNLYQEARGLWVGAMSSRYLGDFPQSMIQL